VKVSDQEVAIIISGAEVLLRNAVLEGSRQNDVLIVKPRPEVPLSQKIRIKKTAFRAGGGNIGVFIPLAEEEELDIVIADSCLTGYLADQGKYAVYVGKNPSAPVEAKGNWWGSVDGPDAPGNTNPTGSRLKGDVLFGPWLNECPVNNGDEP